MRKITKNNITNEISKAINTAIKYLNTYNTTWNVEIMELTGCQSSCTKLCPRLMGFVIII